ncbi:unnamed protein product [Bemisia tabaci]|uniref:Uncharacterized protein n=1 Tax=Bemisia tabaci TaxID=7038 RepID=A0A9P0C6U3_BEMTA|nr:unnamed protein product [Bemisia tabaci]
MLIQWFFLPIILVAPHAVRHKHHNYTSGTPNTISPSSLSIVSSPSSKSTAYSATGKSIASSSTGKSIASSSTVKSIASSSTGKSIATSASTISATSTNVVTPKDEWTESVELKPADRNSDRDPFGLTKTLGLLPSLPDYPRSLHEPKHQLPRKPTNRNTLLPVLARRHDAPALSMFPSLFDDFLVRSMMFDAIDDAVNRGMSEILDTNPGDLIGNSTGANGNSSVIRVSVNGTVNRVKRCHSHERSMFPDEGFHLPNAEDFVSTSMEDLPVARGDDVEPALHIRFFRIFSFPNTSQKSLTFRLGKGPRSELPEDFSLKDGELRIDESSTVTRLCIGGVSKGFWTGMGGIVVFLILCHVACFLLCLVVKKRMAERKQPVLNM